MLFEVKGVDGEHHKCGRLQDAIEVVSDFFVVQIQVDQSHVFFLLVLSALQELSQMKHKVPVGCLDELVEVFVLQLLDCIHYLCIS